MRLQIGSKYRPRETQRTFSSKRWWAWIRNPVPGVSHTYPYRKKNYIYIDIWIYIYIFGFIYIYTHNLYIYVYIYMCLRFHRNMF